jgi:hypothetical protein
VARAIDGIQNYFDPEVSLPEDYDWEFTFRNLREVDELLAEVWPKFSFDWPFTPEQEAEADLILKLDYYHLWGVRHRGELVATMSAVTLQCDQGKTELPNTGWTWARKRSAEPGPHNTLCLLSASVSPDHRKRGLAACLLSQGKALVKNLNFNTVIAPIRPTLKAKYPEVSMASYLNMKNEEGEILDPWLRQQALEGADIMNVCSVSFIVQAPIKDWERWTQRSYAQNGKYRADQALALVTIDLNNNLGTYVEENVWIKYKV